MAGMCAGEGKTDLTRARSDLRASLLLVGSLTALSLGCAAAPVTVAIHDPIYPGMDQRVTYTLERVSGSGLKRVDLYETVSMIDANGAMTSSGAEALLRSWTSPGSRVDFTKDGGYPENSLVRYRFVVKGRCGIWPLTVTYAHEITFARRPYPVPLNAAPVYVAGDPADAFDIVLIPDLDIPDDHMEMFRSNCRGMIRDAFLAEPTIRIFRRSFNFYINPSPGQATDSSSLQDHQVPGNWTNLSFAEAHVLMHEGSLWDYSLPDLGLFSTEMGNRGTMLHEAGHVLFKLKDEYQGGKHEKVIPFPNNWPSVAEASADAPRAGKSSSDISKIGFDPWWKLCTDQCQMYRSGLSPTAYDKPCSLRVVWSVLDNATQ